MRLLADIQAVLFDLGGTLADYPVPAWPRLVLQCLRGVYGTLISPASKPLPPAAAMPDPDEAHARRRRPRPDTPAAHRVMIALRRIVRGVSGHTLPSMAEFCTRPLVAEGRLFEDSLPTLRALRERGYRLGLVSNTPWGTPEYLWEKQLEQFGLDAWFDVSLFSSGIGFRKPDARIFQAALEGLGIPAEAVLFVGNDPEADVAGALRLGMRAALILRPGAAPAPASPPPDLCVRTLAELLVHLPPHPKSVDTSATPA